MKFLLPKQPIFFDLFNKINDSLREMAFLFKEFAADFNDFEGFSDKAKKIEHNADSITHEIINQLNQTFITPFDREDIYLLAQNFDDIIDLIENVIQNIRVYQVRKKNEAIDEFAILISEASDALSDLMKCFQRQKVTFNFKEIKIRIHNLEDRGDAVFQRSISKLFEEENDPLLVIKWKDILENLEKIMDTFQNVTDVVEGIIVKSS